ncbi:MAG: hypothetical protein U9N49_12905 [Campylobacterota bacterium]|nr:hypothetical protein [Campylobacterota bacterium]
MKKEHTSTKIHYLQEVKYITVEYSNIQPIDYTIELNNDLTKEESSWNTILRAVDSSQDIENTIQSFISKIKNSHYEYQDEYSTFFDKISHTYREYQLEASEKKSNKFHEVSVNSFFQLIRFIPEFPKQNLDIYLDERTGCFGVVIKSKLKSKPLLNLLMQDNKEIIFSYIKRRKKIIKISGRAYFNDEYEDSCEMKRLIRMISE